MRNTETVSFLKKKKKNCFSSLKKGSTELNLKNYKAVVCKKKKKGKKSEPLSFVRV